MMNISFKKTMRGVSLIDKVLLYFSKKGTRGFKKLFSVMQKYSKKKFVNYQNKYGCVLSLYPFHHIDQNVLRYGYYEDEVLEALINHLEPGAVFWDVGANFGLHSIAVSRIRPDVTICSFEPMPDMFKRLENHVNANGQRSRLFQLGLGHCREYMTLHYEDNLNPGISSFSPSENHHYSGTIKCAVCRADQIIRDGIAPCPNVMKMDIEGFEFNALSGFGDYLKKESIKTIILECSERIDLPDCNHPVRGLLISAGFVVCQLKRPCSDPGVPENYVAKK